MGIYIFGMLTTLMIEVITLSYSSKVKFDFLHIVAFILLMIVCIPIKISNLIIIIGGVLITYHQDNGRDGWLRYIIFVMYSFITTWILQVVLNFCGNKIYDWFSYNNYLGTLACQSIIFLIQVGIIYWFKDSLEILSMSDSSKKRKMELVAIVFLAIYLIYGSTFNDNYNSWWVSIYVIGLILFLGYIRALALLETKRELDELKDFELQNIENYANKIEEMYQGLRRFRHDYLNILLSMDQAIKSILYNKFSYATREGVELEIEINDDVTIQYTRLLDTVRILSILLDNAIEAALESKEPRLLVAYIKETDIERVIIENSTKVERVEIAPLFKENYTTKSGNRGQGLATVKRLIGHYPNVSLKTSSRDYTFTQDLVLNKEEKR